MEPRWFRLLCLSLVVMRCQPFRRALCVCMLTCLCYIPFV
ncbi:superoxide dismutase [Vibrio cholerae]|nr:superoxide dismutase [Vibrio cholerae]